MSISEGSRLGPYEVLAPLGSGGMGDVYRARDHKLDRDVALKVLAPDMANDPVALARFEREAKAVATLSHPNILAIFDFGRINETAFAIMELLDGETLKERLTRGPVAATEAIAWTTQIAEGLAAAHDRGIVHRDLKPANIVITRQGRVKILDFGLAQVHPLADVTGETVSMPAGPTNPGMVLGTVGYMAPEQVRGESADYRADIFGLGCLLYEMLSGRRAFHGINAIETMVSILRDDPPPLQVAGTAASPVIERIVMHCLEKDAARRFQSMRDLAFDLSSLAEPSTWTTRAPRVPRDRRRRALWFGGAAAAVAFAVAAFWLGGLRSKARPAAAEARIGFQTVSFGRGMIDGARFTPDGESVVFGAAWDGGPFKLRLTRPGNPETSTLDLPDADLLAVSAEGELAIALDYRLTGWMGRGTLARVPMLGAAPRQVADDVLAADWSPDGAELAVVRWAMAGKRLEYPVGTVRYRTGGWISHPRVSADGSQIAFLDHPVDGDDRGRVALLDLATGKQRPLGPDWSGIQGLAWAPSGSELIFSAYDGSTPQSVYAVDLEGRTRQLLTGPTGLFLQDVAQDGRVLVASQTRTIQIVAQRVGSGQSSDLSWLAYSFATDISADGRTVLLECAGDSCGTTYSVFVRSIDGSPAVRLGEGSARALSPDGKLAAALVFGTKSRPHVVLYPLGAGQPRTIDIGRHTVEEVDWRPDGRGLVVVAGEPGGGKRGYTVDLATGTWTQFTPEGVSAGRKIPVTPDDKDAVLFDPDGRLSLFPLDGGPARGIAGAEPGDQPVRFTRDGRTLYLARHEVPLRILALDLTTGERALVSEIPSPDPAGLQAAFPGAVISEDGKTMVGTYTHRLNKLYVVSGVR